MPDPTPPPEPPPKPLEAPPSVRPLISELAAVEGMSGRAKVELLDFEVIRAEVFRQIFDVLRLQLMLKCFGPFPCGTSA